MGFEVCEYGGLLRDFFFKWRCWIGFLPTVAVDVVAAIVVGGHCCGSGGCAVVAVVVDDNGEELKYYFNVL